MAIIPFPRIPLIGCLALFSAGGFCLAPPCLTSSVRPVQAQYLAPLMPPEILPAQPQIQQILDRLVQRGFVLENQGIWLQSEETLLAAHHATTPLPAASITKAATTLAALHLLGAGHRFTTQFSSTGSIRSGILEGDLVVSGGQDPFFVWEDAVAVGQALNQLGIRQVQGNLVITGPFFMNFRTEAQVAGELLKAGLDGSSWPQEAEIQFQQMPPDTSRPQVQILGSLQTFAEPAVARPLIRHHSLPLLELLKRMNRYSNNIMADLIAESLGGATVVAEVAAELSGVPTEEIQLINGSGLGIENRLSPRAACGIFLAIRRDLDAQNLSLGDAFQIVDRDEGVLEQRVFPAGVIAKSGTLNQVSGLAGILPTQQQDQICFAILNVSFDLASARAAQTDLLQSLAARWGSISELPSNLSPRLSPQMGSPATEIVP